MQGETQYDVASYVSMSDDGDTVTIGSRREDDLEHRADRDFYVLCDNSDGEMGTDPWVEDFGNGCGAAPTIYSKGYVRIYDWNIIAWEQRGLNINGEAAGDHAGYVSMSNDGNRVLIGAAGNDGNGEDSGHARIFDWNGSAWLQTGQDIDGQAGKPACLAWEGLHDKCQGDRTVGASISNDGNTVAMRGQYNDGNGEDSGYVRIYDLK